MNIRTFFPSLSLFSEKYFSYFVVGCFLLLGMLSATLIPPLTVTDEPLHFQKAYGISEGYFFCERDLTSGKVGMFVPKNIHQIEDHTVFQNTAYHLAVPATPEFFSLFQTVPSKEYAFVNSPYCETPFWSSLPQAFGIFIGKVFGAHLDVLVLLGRLCNLLVSGILLFFALSLCIRTRWFIVATMFLPMFLQQASSVTVDPVHYAGLLLLFALTGKYLFQDDKYTNTQLLLYFLLSVLLIYSKVGYFAFICLPLLFPYEKFYSKKHQWIFLVSFFLGHSIVFYLVRHIFTAGTWSIERANLLSEILHSPLDYLVLIFRTCVLHFEMLGKGVLGMLGWVNVEMSNWIYTFLIFFLGYCFWNAPSIELSKKQHLTLTGILIFGVFCVFTALYILGGQVHPNTIELLQGKYFLPLLPLMFFWLKYFIKTPISPMRVSIFLFSMVVIGIGLFTTLYMRYYSLHHVSYHGGVDQEVQTFTTNPIFERVSLSHDINGLGVKILRQSLGVEHYILQVRDVDCKTIFRSSSAALDLENTTGTVHVFFDKMKVTQTQTYCIALLPINTNQQSTVQVWGWREQGTGTGKDTSFFSHMYVELIDR